MNKIVEFNNVKRWADKLVTDEIIVNSADRDVRAANTTTEQAKFRKFLSSHKNIISYAALQNPNLTPQTLITCLEHPDLRTPNNQLPANIIPKILLHYKFDLEVWDYLITSLLENDTKDSYRNEVISKAETFWQMLYYAQFNYETTISVYDWVIEMLKITLNKNSPFLRKGYETVLCQVLTSLLFQQCFPSSLKTELWEERKEALINCFDRSALLPMPSKQESLERSWGYVPTEVLVEMVFNLQPINKHFMVWVRENEVLWREKLATYFADEFETEDFVNIPLEWLHETLTTSSIKLFMKAGK